MPIWPENANVDVDEQKRSRKSPEEIKTLQVGVKKQRDRKCHASQATQWRSVTAIKFTLLRKICSLLRLFFASFCSTIVYVFF